MVGKDGFFEDAFQWTNNSNILKFILGCEAWDNKTKEIIFRLNNK